MEFIHLNSLIAFSVLLLIGIIGGRIAHFLRFIPKITGFILAGFFLGPHFFGVLTPELIESGKIFSEIAVSLIMFELGSQIKFSSYRHSPHLVWMGLTESLLSFLLIFMTLQIFNINVLNSLLIAAIGVSASPAITMLIAEEYNASGPVISRSLFLTAFNNIMSFCLYTIIIFFFQITMNEHHNSIWQVLHPLYSLFGSIILAMSLSVAMIVLGRFLGKDENTQFAALIAMLILANGVANALHLSPLLTSLIFGIATINLDTKDRLLEVEFGHSGEVFYVILFVFAGANLHASMLIDIGWLAFAFILARFIGKFIPIAIIGRQDHVKESHSFYLTLTLLPMAGTAISLLGSIKSISIETSVLIYTIVLASIAVLETIGPIITLLSLRLCGELTPKQPPGLTEVDITRSG